MSAQSRPAATSPPSVGRIVVAGIAALAVAMGIGRFAFTPLMPLMLRDGGLDAAAGAEWAAANYIGYLVGALTAARFARNPLRGLLLSLWGVVVATFLVGTLVGPLLQPIGASLRFAAGVLSAWTLVCGSSWCLTELALRGAGHRAAWVYTGVGIGICLAGLFAWVGGAQAARTLWLELGVLAAAGALLARPTHSASSKPSPARDRSVPIRSPQEWAFVFCYGIFGFGYIMPATFLPAMAREQVADPLVFGLTWPLFGLAAALSVAGVALWLRSSRRRAVWSAAQAIMALGTGVVLVSQSMLALAVSAVLVGGTFMVATMAGLQLARELAPQNPTPLLARMTVAFASGQIAGPLLVRWLGTERVGGHAAVWWGNLAATVLLALTAAWLAHRSSHAIEQEGSATF